MSVSPIEQIKDIAEVTPANWWPLAPVFWVGIALTCAVVFWITYKAIKYYKFKSSWKYSLYNELVGIENKLHEADVYNSVSNFSKYLRIMNIKMFGREDCASLTGVKWIEWLQRHDPYEYNWMQHKTILLDIPYQDFPGSNFEVEIKDMIQAVKKWLRF